MLLVATTKRKPIKCSMPGSLTMAQTNISHLLLFSTRNKTASKELARLENLSVALKSGMVRSMMENHSRSMLLIRPLESAKCLVELSQASRTMLKTNTNSTLGTKENSLPRRSLNHTENPTLS